MLQFDNRSCCDVRMVRKELHQINSVLLVGVLVDNTIGSLVKLADATCFGDAGPYWCTL